MPKPRILRANCRPGHMTRASSRFCHCPQFYIKTASKPSISPSLSAIIPSGSSYSSILLPFMHKFGLAAVSYVLVFIFWFYALVFFSHFWPASPLNWLSIQQIVIESLLCSLITRLELQSTSVDQRGTILYEEELDSMQMFR